MPMADAWAFTQAHHGESETWKNEITVRSLELASTYEPAALIHMIWPRPFQMIICATDRVTTPDIAQAVYDRAGQPENLVVLDGGHFDLYYDQFDKASKLAIDWFQTHL